MAVNIVSFDRAALLLKEEVTYGTDPTPTGATDSMLISNGRIRFQANKLSRDLDKSYLGASPFVLTGRQAFIEFDFEVMGSATAGNASPIAPILLVTAHAETLVPATSAEYNPVSSAFKSGAAYFYVPGGNALGATQHIVLGMRGTVTFNMSINGYVKGHAVLTGQEATLSNAAFPSQTLTAFQIPIAVTEGTWTVALDDGGGAFNVDCVELNLDQGGQVQLYETSEQQLVQVVGRDSQGYLRIMDPALADFDAFSLATAGTLVDIQATVNGGAGKTLLLQIGQAQLDYPERIDIDGASGLRIPFTALPSDAGNDEYSLLFT